MKLGKSNRSLRALKMPDLNLKCVMFAHTLHCSITMMLFDSPRKLSKESAGDRQTDKERQRDWGGGVLSERRDARESMKQSQRALGRRVASFT